MRLGGHFTWLNKMAIVEYKVAIELLLIFHYCNKNKHSHEIFGDIISW